MKNKEDKFAEFLASRIDAMSNKDKMRYASNATVRMLFENDAYDQFERIGELSATSGKVAKKAKSAMRMRRINPKRPILCH